jgi:[lysine-biosynthesis-protein LysW]---L-2-aminoadipate ligase
MRFFLVARALTPTNAGLLGAFRRTGIDSRFLQPAAALRRVLPGDVVLARLDVAPSLDRVDEGLRDLDRLTSLGARLLNGSRALLAAHDKLLTATVLREAGIAHPRTDHVLDGEVGELEPPVVVKPRFGSWGRDVVRCEDGTSLDRHLAGVRRRSWFRRHGALVQEVIPPSGFDLRLIVAGGEVVGAIQRVGAPGEWRTNIALGGHRQPVIPPAEARELALAAAAAIGGDLVGVDLLPTANGGWTVLEINGAVDFTSEYSLGHEIFDEIPRALGVSDELAVALPALS